MRLTPIQSQILANIADILYNFLPGQPHPFADQAISFIGIAHKLRLANYWIGGSKKPAITKLLSQTYELQRHRFSDLILEVVNTGIIYRSNKQPITQEEIKELTKLLERLQVRIPELSNKDFISSLPTLQKQESQKQEVKVDLTKQREKFNTIMNSNPQRRGFEFESFLSDLFLAFGLKPRQSFRIIGEQIDGSFELDSQIYLLEAKWHNEPIPASDLRIFRDKIEGKSNWTRGLFISYSNFSEEGLAAFARGKATNAIGVSGQDLHFILQGDVSLVDAIKMKARRAAETGEFYISIYDLIRMS